MMKSGIELVLRTTDDFASALDALDRRTPEQRRRRIRDACADQAWTWLPVAAVCDVAVALLVIALGQGTAGATSLLAAGLVLAGGALALTPLLYGALPARPRAAIVWTESMLSAGGVIVALAAAPRAPTLIVCAAAIAATGISRRDAPAVSHLALVALPSSAFAWWIDVWIAGAVMLLAVATLGHVLATRSTTRARLKADQDREELEQLCRLLGGAGSGD